ncbi:hypothetical protein [Flavobacterium daejeonense]|uniref:hypothetical protein n=1 Tax=Flavobacterium daejeonense TaxID=350893 RepID=UPI00047DFEFA|nr:hypothetical protein [Flavobacterium daejeonense]
MKNSNYNQENDNPDNDYQGYFIERLERNPKMVFKAMILILGVSIVGSVLYSVFKEPYVRKPLVVKSNSIENTLSTGLGGLINAGSSINEIKDLDSKIQTILAKKTLTKQDSTELLNSLNELQIIQKRLNPKK